MLWLTHTLSKPSSMTTLCMQPRMFRPCFSIFLPPQIITEKVVWSRKTIPRWPRSWLILIMSYFVVHHYWINPQKILWEMHLSFHFWSAYLFAFLFWYCHICSMVHTHFSALLQVVLLALTSFGSLALWLTQMVSFHIKEHEVVLTLFMFEIL